MADGLFDFGGGGLGGGDSGGFDMDSLMQRILGINQAGAQPSNMTIQPGNPVGPNGAPGVPLTPDALAGSNAANNLADSQVVNPAGKGDRLPLPGQPPVSPVITPPGGPMRNLGGTWGPGGPSPMTPGGQSTEAGPTSVGGAPLPDSGPTSVGGAPLGQGPTVGAALMGNTPAAMGTSGATDLSAQAKEKAAGDTLAKALQGVKAPAPPVQQKISSPSPPRATGQIKGGELQALLMALNAGAPNMARQLPVTLGGR